MKSVTVRLLCNYHCTQSSATGLSPVQSSLVYSIMSNDESSSGVPVKTYTHVPPRIDPEWYQAEIPYPCRGPLPPEGKVTCDME